MLNTLLWSLGIPPGQVSLSWPLSPCPPCPSPYLHPLCSQLVFFCFYIILHPFTFTSDIFTPTQPPFSVSYQPYPPTPHFAFLVFSMAVPLLPAPSPTLTYWLALFSHVPLPLPGPSHPPASTCPPYPHFAFLILSVAIPMLPAPSPTLIYSLVLFSHVPLPLPGPSHPPYLPTCPSTPHFAFLGHLWTLFGVHSYLIPSTCVHTWFIALNREHLTAFFGATSCQGKGNVLLSTVENRPPQGIQIFMHALWCMINVSHTEKRQWGGPVVAYCNPNWQQGRLHSHQPGPCANSELKA